MAYTVARTTLCSLSFNYSMNSYLVVADVLPQKAWRTITARSRKGREKQKNRSTEGSFVLVCFLKNFSVSLFFLFISYTRFHPRTLLTQGMNLRPLSQVSSSLRVMRQTGSAVFIPSWDCQDLVDLVPREVHLIAFSGGIIGQDAAGARVSLQERRTVWPLDSETITAL